MKIYISLSSIPELQGLSPNDRQRVWSESYLKVIWGRVGMLGVLIMAGCSSLGWYLDSMLESGSPIGQFVPYLFVVLGVFLFFALAVSKARQLMPKIISQMEENRN